MEQLANHFFTIAILSAFPLTIAGLEEGDVIGSLGYGRTFVTWTANDTDPYGYIEMVDVVGSILMDQVPDPQQCCEECKKSVPETQMINWLKNFFAPPKPVHFCECLKPLGERRVMTRDAGSVNGFCGENSVEADGEVGENRLFKYKTMELFAEVAADREDDCCEECKTVSNETELFEFVSGQFAKDYKQCYCGKLIPGMRPITKQALEFAAHVCESGTH